MSKTKPYHHDLYTLLTGDEDARVCKDIPESACHEQPRSYLIHLISLTATKVGDGLADAKLVLAWLLGAVGAPAALLAFLVPIRESLSLAPQLFIAAVMRRQPIRKTFLVWGSLGQAFSLMLMAMSAMILEGAAAGWAILGCLALFSLSRGINSVAQKDVLGKTVGKARRGSVSGWAASLGGVAVVLFGLALQFLAPEQPPVWLFAVILMAAAGLWMVSAGVISSLDEAPGATSGGGNAITEAVKSLGLAWTDTTLRNFLLARSLLLGTALVTPFYVLLAQEKTGGGLGGLGAMVVAAGLASALSSAVWGRLADISSRMVMIAGAGIGAVLAFTIAGMAWTGAALLETLSLHAGVLFIIGIAHSGVQLGRKTYLIDAATAENRAAYVAVSNTVMGLVLLAASAFGLLAQTLGVAAVIFAFGLMAGVGAVWTWIMPDHSNASSPP